MPAVPPPSFFSVTTLARCWAVHTRTVRRAIKKGLMKATPDGARVPLAEVEKFMRKRSIGAVVEVRFLGKNGRPRELWSPESVATALDFSRRTIKRRVHARSVEAYSLFPRVVRIPQDATPTLVGK